MRPAGTTRPVIRGKPVMLPSDSTVRLRRRLGKRHEKGHPLLGKGPHFRIMGHPGCLILPKIKKAVGQRIVVDLLRHRSLSTNFPPVPGAPSPSAKS
jgi:hypothetical protein